MQQQRRGRDCAAGREEIDAWATTNDDKTDVCDPQSAADQYNENSLRSISMLCDHKQAGMLTEFVDVALMKEMEKRAKAFS